MSTTVISILLTLSIFTFQGCRPWKPTIYPTTNLTYVVTGNFTKEHQQIIAFTMKYFSTVTCMNFTYQQVAPRNEAYFNITRVPVGCYTWLGKPKNSLEHPISISSYFLERIRKFPLSGNLLHEIEHALGLPHEHQRPNRDQYIQMHWDLVNNTRVASQFEWSQETLVDAYLYDYYSIMHYGPRIEDLDGKESFIILHAGINANYVGQRFALTESDAQRLNQIYGCSADYINRTIRSGAIHRVQLGSTGTYLLWPNGTYCPFYTADITSPCYPKRDYSYYDDNEAIICTLLFLFGSIAIWYYEFYK